jgi:cytochrome c
MNKNQLFKRLAMSNLLIWVAALAIIAQTPSKRVLVFSKTMGFRHASIPTGKAAIMKLGTENGFAVDTTEDAAKFTEANLKKYNAVIFLSTTGNALNTDQEAAFERYIQAGGGYVGIHAASDTEYDWAWYGKLVGGYFASHPGNPNVQTGEAFAVNKSHPSMFGFPDRWKIKDEFYDFKQMNPAVNVLVKMDEKTYKDGKMGDNHPMAWYHDYDGGKAWYTNFGHTDETFSEPVFVKHLLGGIQSVMAQKLDYSKSKPEENRFTKTILTEKLDEPTELAVLDDQRVLFAERKGALKLYDPKTKQTKVVAQMPVYSKFEYGLMGLNIDPNFKTNKWLYLYYSPLSSEKDTAQRLVRVKYDDVKNELVPNSEQVLLRVPVKRNDCCHTGGSIAWDKKGNLYLSTGDDVNPFQSDGYGPIDGREGRKGFDGRASSSNTNDLRGKILRIKPNDDGTYAIPEGNLFPVGNDKARPEIYVMGNRNPYRIAVDQRNGFLYWGEVGPDAGENKEGRGPRGHDEVNQARKAGYFGWPLFVADNRPYNQYDFEKKESGPLFDPNKPINNSMHNTGLTELPPAQKAFIYYPYVESPEFGAIVGKGGRNAMGGPVYYYDDYPESNVKFPRYYDGKFFAYEWMRDWIHPVTMNSDGDFVSMETFMPGTKFSHPIDMQFAKDGSFYVLEYGNNWFAQNDDARLSRITYTAGNRNPVAAAAVSKKAGAAPMKVTFSSAGSLDYDGDALSYEWSFGKGLPKSNQANPTFTYTKPGNYTATLKLTDAAGNTSSQNVDVKVGNEPPKVEVAIAGNKTFYWDNKPVSYEVKVIDKEDGSLANGKIAAEDVNVSIDYLEGFDKTMLAQGHQANLGLSSGKRLIELSDCKACHGIDKKSVGPAYREVAKKYKGAFMIEGKLSDKIIKGGGGVWGEQAMSAHPQVSKEDATEMVRYIMSLADDKPKQPVKGSYLTTAKAKDGQYIISASYTDKGKSNLSPQTASASYVLRPAKLKAVAFDGAKDHMKYKLPTNAEVVVATAPGGYFMFKDVDLTDINSVSLMAFSTKEQTQGGDLEIRIGSPTGPLIGSVEIANGTMGIVNSTLKKPEGSVVDLYFVFKKTNPEAGKALYAIDTVQFNSATPTNTGR